MSQTVTQSVAANVVVLLTKDSVAVVDLEDADVTAQYCKDGGTFASKTLDSGNFTEIGLGYYKINFTAAELDTLGPFLVVVSGSDIDQSNTQIEVVASAEDSTAVNLQTCVISGYLFDPSGRPLIGSAVSARPVGLPAIEQSVAAISDDLVTAVTNVNGQFFITLIRLADMEVFIPAVNYRKRIVVPNQGTAELFSLE